MNLQQIERELATHNNTLAEYQILGGDPYNDDYLVIEVEAGEEGLTFSADFKHNNYFSGEVEEIADNIFLLPFDDCKTFYEMLEQINCEVYEGYILANNLEVKEI